MTTTLCGNQPNEADCSFCLDIYECRLMQEAEKRKGGMILPEADGGRA